MRKKTTTLGGRVQNSVTQENVFQETGHEGFIYIREANILWKRDAGNDIIFSPSNTAKFRSGLRVNSEDLHVSEVFKPRLSFYLFKTHLITSCLCLSTCVTTPRKVFTTHFLCKGVGLCQEKLQWAAVRQPLVQSQSLLQTVVFILTGRKAVLQHYIADCSAPNKAKYAICWHNKRYYLKKMTLQDILILTVSHCWFLFLPFSIWWDSSCGICWR